MPSKGDVEFGQLAIREKLSTKERVEECLKFMEEVEKEGKQTTVDRVMLSKGYLTEPQVFDLNKKQGRRVVFCTKCLYKLNVAGLSVGQKVTCPKCSAPNVTPEKIVFEVMERSKPQEGVGAKGNTLKVSLPAGQAGEVKPPAAAEPQTELPAPPPPIVEPPPVPAPPPVPPPIPTEASAPEKISDAPKTEEGTGAESRGKRYATRRYGKR